MTSYITLANEYKQNKAWVYVKVTQKVKWEINKTKICIRSSLTNAISNTKAMMQKNDLGTVWKPENTSGSDFEISEELGNKWDCSNLYPGLSAILWKGLNGPTP